MLWVVKNYFMQSIYYFPTQSVTDTNFQRQRIRQQFCDFLFHWGRGPLVLTLNTPFTRTHGKLSLWARHLNVPVHLLLSVSPFLSMANSIFLGAQSEKPGLTLDSYFTHSIGYGLHRIPLQNSDVEFLTANPSECGLIWK